MATLTRTVVVLLVLSGTTSPAQALAAETVWEPTTRVAFPKFRQWGGRRFVCVGTGFHKVFLLFKVWGGCAYVDKQSGRESLLRFLNSAKGGGVYAPGKLDKERLLDSPEVYNWLVWADLPMIIDMVLVRAVSAEDVKTDIKKQTAPYLSSASPVWSRFFEPVGGGLGKWDHMLLLLMPGGKVTLQYGKSVSKAPTVSKRLAAALLGMKLGWRTSLSDKRSWLRNIERLLD